MKTIILTNTIFLLWCLPLAAWAQVLSLSGYITNSVNGEALENVSVFESNSRIGTISNKNGFYRLILNDQDVDLKISSEGFVAYMKHIDLSSDTTLIVKLEPLADEKAREKSIDDVRADANKKQEKKKVTRRDLKLF